MAPLTPEEREQELREQEKFILDMQHKFVEASHLVDEGELILKKMDEDLKTRLHLWQEAKNHIAQKQKAFADKLTKTKGLPEEKWDFHRSEIESALREYKESVNRGVSHIRP